MIRRLIATYLLITVIVLVLLEVPFGVTLARRERAELVTGMERDAFVLATWTVDELEHPGSVQGVPSRLATYYKETGANIVVIDPTGITRFDTSGRTTGRPTLLTADLQHALAGGVVSGEAMTARHKTHITVAVPVARTGKVIGALRIDLPAGALEARIRRHLFRLLAIAAVALLVVGLVGVLLARSVTRPVRRIRRAAADLGSGDMAARVGSMGGAPELVELGASFDETAGRLQDLMRAQDAFVADASHQLRSPLTALRLRLETIDAPGAEEDVDRALDECGRLSRTIDGLLQLARQDQASPPSDEMVLGDVARDRFDIWQPLADERGVALMMEIPQESGTIRADPERVAQVIDNLVANALDVSPVGSTLAIVVGVTARAAAVAVRDQGPGMTDEQLTHAFDRFWRASSRRTALGGSGLGLPIAQSLAAADGGTIRLSRRGGDGLDAIVSYPCNGPVAARRGSGSSTLVPERQRFGKGVLTRRHSAQRVADSPGRRPSSAPTDTPSTHPAPIDT